MTCSPASCTSSDGRSTQRRPASGDRGSSRSPSCGGRRGRSYAGGAMIRTLVVGTLLGLAGLLSIIGNTGLWVDRTVYDTDNFVATTDDVLDDPDVQEVLAERFA